MRSFVKTFFAVMVLGALVAGCGSSGGGGGNSSSGAVSDTTGPIVIFSTPNSLLGAKTDSKITIIFSEAIDDTTISGTSILLVDNDAGGATIPFTVDNYNEATKVVTLTPSVLTDNHEYTATVTTGIKDLAGNPLALAYSWTFEVTDTTVVTSTSPTNGATGVATNTSFAITFSKPINEDSVRNAFSLTSGAGPVTGTLNFYGQVAVFTPTSLDSSTPYTVTLANTATDSTGRKLAGNQPNGDYLWTFTTGTETDTSAPEVLSVTPANGATDVPRNTAIIVEFKEAVNPDITGIIDGQPTDVIVDYTTNTVKMIPTVPLKGGTTYPFSIQVTDLAGNLMASSYSWSFTTAN